MTGVAALYRQGRLERWPSKRQVQVRFLSESPETMGDGRPASRDQGPWLHSMMHRTWVWVRIARYG